MWSSTTEFITVLSTHGFLAWITLLQIFSSPVLFKNKVALTLYTQNAHRHCESYAINFNAKTVFYKENCFGPML